MPMMNSDNQDNILDNININHFVQYDYHSMKGTNDLRIIYINARSLRGKIPDIENSLNRFHKRNKSVHVLVISEIWIYESETKYFNIKNFNAVHCTRDSDRGGGVSIYVHNSIGFNEVLKLNSEDNSFLVIKLLPSNFNIIGLYREKNTNIDNFFQNVEVLLHDFPKSFVFGDFNINWFDTSNIKRIRLNESTLNNGFVVLNNTQSVYATRVEKTSATSIDYAISDCVTLSFDYSLEDISYSDHKMIILEVNHRLPTPPSNNTLSYLDYDLLQTDNIFPLLSFSTSIKKFTDPLTFLIEKYTKIIPTIKKRKQWMNRGLLKLIKNRELFYKLLKKHPNNVYIKQQFNKFRNLVNNLRKKLKMEYFHNLFHNNKGNLKNTWDILNYLIFNKSKSSSQPQLFILHDNAIRNDPLDIANIFNDHFINVSKSVHIRPPINCKVIIPHFLSYLNIPLPITYLEFTRTDDYEILNILNCINKSAATGSDYIPIKLIIRFKHVIVPILTNLINSSIFQGVFPDSMKIAKVFPLFKAGDRTLVSNYRPISILNSISKIIEFIMLNRLQTFFQDHSIINKGQFGFKKKSSTQLAVANAMNQILTALDDKFYVAALFIDIHKAFDCVDHCILLQKLKHLNPTFRAYCLLQSYLENRKQFTVTNGTFSELRSMISGVPQGSILSPELFNFYMNDIFNLNLHGKLQLYADDALIVYKATTASILLIHMKEDILLINNWLSANKLTLNLSKTKYLMFQTKGRSLMIPTFFEVNSIKIPQVSNYNYLGLIIDDKLDWTPHVTKIQNKVLSMNFALKRIRYCIAERTAWMLYFAFAHSHFCYMIVFWSSASVSLLSRLARTQNKIVKTIRLQPYLFPTVRLFSTNILPIVALAKFESFLLIHKIMLGYLNCILEFQQISDIHSYNTRSRSHFYVNTARTQRGSSNVFSHRLTLYNNLPQEIKTLNLKNFKLYLKSQLYLEWLGPNDDPRNEY